MTARLVLATRNRAKLAELDRILRAAGVRAHLLTLDDVHVPEVVEHGATFAENARAKALYYAEATGLPAVADDSGLEVDAIGGAPGVQSARFPGETYPEKFVTLFRMLDERGVETSAARFVCALALADAGRVVFEARGVVEGRITREPRGTGGFGYDPIFYYPPFDKTLAEVSAEDKTRVSHRGKAFGQLREYLSTR